MINPEKYTGAVLLGLSIFLMLDAFLAFVVGERYRYWGLRYMPAWYRSLIFKIYDSPACIVVVDISRIHGWVCFCIFENNKQRYRNNLLSQESIINMRKHDFKLPAYKCGIQGLFNR